MEISKLARESRSGRSLATSVVLANLLLLIGPRAVSAAPSLVRYPYLTDLQPSHVIVNFATDTVAPAATVSWRAGPGASCADSSVTATGTSMQVNGVTEYQFSAALGNLAHQSQYSYRVCQAGSDLLGADPSPVFMTGPGPSTFSFAVLGDWGDARSGNNPDQANVLQHIAESGASFVVTTGDNAYPSGSQTDYGDLLSQHQSSSGVFAPNFWKSVGAGMPAFPAVGNHGFSLASVQFTNWPEAATVGASGGRYQNDTYCCLWNTSPGNYPSTWYAFDYGPARFYVLDAAWSESNVGAAPGGVYQLDHDYHWTTTSPQYLWLANDLATHNTPLKFAFFHYPLYTDGGEPSDTYLQGAAPQLEGLLASNGVDMVFNGHAHIYERNLSSFTVPNSSPPVPLVDYVTGGGGAQLQSVIRHSAFDQYATSIYHFLLVQVNGSGQVIVTPQGEVGGTGSWGTFDVQTYNYVPPGAMSGTVTDAKNGQPISGATVSYRQGSTTTNSSGSYRLSNVAPGSYPVTASATNHLSQSQNVTVTSSQTTDQNFSLAPIPPMYTLDGYGGLHPNGTSPPLAITAYWSGWKIAHAAALLPDGSGGYVLDGYGGLHPFGSTASIVGEAYWSGWDIARDVVLLPTSSGTSPAGYTLDGYGGVHPFGKAPPVHGASYFGFDIAKRIALLSDGSGGYVLDGYGGLHPFAVGSSPQPPPVVSVYWPNWNIARDVILTPGSTGTTVAGFTLDGYGGLHPFGLESPPTGFPYWNWDIARAVRFADSSRPSSPAGWVLDGYGGVHPFGGAPAQSGPYFGFDIAVQLIR